MVDEFRHRVEGIPTLVPEGGFGKPPYSTIGTAVDYRLQYYFREPIIETTEAFRGMRHCSVHDPSGALEERVMVPLYGAQLSKQIPARCSIPRVARDFFASFRALLNELGPVRRRLDPEDELRLSQYCYVLAIFEQRARVVGEASQKLQLHDLKPGAGVEELLGLAHPAWVRDIGRMSWLFGRRYSRLLHERVQSIPPLEVG